MVLLLLFMRQLSYLIELMMKVDNDELFFKWHKVTTSVAVMRPTSNGTQQIEFHSRTNATYVRSLLRRRAIVMRGVQKCLTII